SGGTQCVLRHSVRRAGDCEGRAGSGIPHPHDGPYRADYQSVQFVLSVTHSPFTAFLAASAELNCATIPGRSVVTCNDTQSLQAGFGAKTAQGHNEHYFFEALARTA